MIFEQVSSNFRFDCLKTNDLARKLKEFNKVNLKQNKNQLRMLSRVIFTAAIVTNVSALLFDAADKKGNSLKNAFKNPDVIDSIDAAEDEFTDLTGIDLPSTADLKKLIDEVEDIKDEVENLGSDAI